MTSTARTGSESLVEAVKLVATEGLPRGLKRDRIVRQIERDSKKYQWTDEFVSTLHPEWQWRLCCARLQLGCLDWKGWEWRNGREVDPFDIPKWKPSYGKVKRLLVYGEQGLGDEVIFSQGLGYLREYADEIVFECEPRLAGIFQRSYPWLEVHGRKDISDGEWATDFDGKIILGEMCRFLTDKTKFKRGAYLVPDKEKVEYWDSRLADDRRVAVMWKGRQAFIEPKTLIREAEKFGKVLSLQHDWDNDSVPVFSPDIDLKNDLEDVFAILSLMERVVSVPTSVVHFAGALGIPTDVILTPGKGEIFNALQWRFGMGGEMVWHSSVKVFRNYESYLRRVS